MNSRFNEGEEQSDKRDEVDSEKRKTQNTSVREYEQLTSRRRFSSSSSVNNRLSERNNERKSRNLRENREG